MVFPGWVLGKGSLVLGGHTRELVDGDWVESVPCRELVHEGGLGLVDFFPVESVAEDVDGGSGGCEAEGGSCRRRLREFGGVPHPIKYVAAGGGFLSWVVDTGGAPFADIEPLLSRIFTVLCGAVEVEGDGGDHVMLVGLMQ